MNAAGGSRRARQRPRLQAAGTDPKGTPGAPARMKGKRINRGPGKGKKGKVGGVRGQTKKRRPRVALGVIEKARRELDRSKAELRESRARLSKDSYSLLAEGMRHTVADYKLLNDDEQHKVKPETTTHATHLLNDEIYTLKFDERKQRIVGITNHKHNPIQTYHQTIGFMKNLSRRLPGSTSDGYVVDSFGHRHEFLRDTGKSDSGEVKLPKDMETLISNANHHTFENPKHISAIFHTSVPESFKKVFHAYLNENGIENAKYDGKLGPSETMNYLTQQLFNMTETNTNCISWEEKPNVHRYHASDHEIVLISQSGCLRNYGELDADIRLSIVRRLVIMITGDRTNRVNRILCEELIVQFNTRGDDADVSKQKYHPTDSALVITARCTQTPDTHFFGNGAFSVKMPRNYTVGRIDRAESAMVIAGWLLGQLQNVTSQNKKVRTHSYEFFSHIFEDGERTDTEYKTRLQARQKENEGKNDNFSLLCNSFVGKQDALNVGSVIDGRYPRIRQWYATPSFAVIAINPANNPWHMYITVVTFSCHAHADKPTQIIKVRATPPPSRSASRAPSRTSSSNSSSDASGSERSSGDSGDRFGNQFRLLDSKKAPAKTYAFGLMSRLPEDLELELQML